MRQNRKKWPILIATVLVVTTALFLVLPKREPRYQGKPLSHWIAAMRETRGQTFLIDDAAPDPEITRIFHEAVQSAGTNAIPYLLAELHYRTPKWRRVAGSFLTKMLMEDWRHEMASLDCAKEGLSELGTNAFGLLPELAGLIDDEDRGETTVAILPHLGDATFTVFTNALTSTNSRIRTAAVQSAGFYKTPELICAVALKCWNDPDPVVRMLAVGLISKSALPPAEAVDKLILALQDPSPTVRPMAIIELSNYDEAGTPALPFLEKFRNDPDENTRILAVSRIHSIKYGVKERRAEAEDRALVLKSLRANGTNSF